MQVHRWALLRRRVELPPSHRDVQRGDVRARRQFLLERRLRRELQRGVLLPRELRLRQRREQFSHMHDVSKDVQRRLLVWCRLDERDRRRGGWRVHCGVLLSRGLQQRDAERVRGEQVLRRRRRVRGDLPCGRLRQRHDEHVLRLLRAVPGGLLLYRGLDQRDRNHLSRGQLLCGRCRRCEPVRRGHVWFLQRLHVIRAVRQLPGWVLLRHGLDDARDVQRGVLLPHELRVRQRREQFADVHDVPNDMHGGFLVWRGLHERDGWRRGRHVHRGFLLPRRLQELHRCAQRRRVYRGLLVRLRPVGGNRQRRMHCGVLLSRGLRVRQRCL